MQAVKINVKGEVQGVFFRAYTQKEAQRIGLIGYVKNIPNGSVEIVAQGEKEQTQQLIEWCHQGSPDSDVTAIETSNISVSGKFKSFEIRY